MKHTGRSESTQGGGDLDVVIVAPGFPRDEADDRCLPALQEFLMGLRDSMPQARLRVLSLHYPFKAGERLWKGLPVTDLGGGNLPWPGRVVYLGRAFRRLSALSREHSPTLVHAFLLTDAALVAAWFARSRSIPCVASLLGQDALQSNRYARWILGVATIVAPSDRAAQAFRENFKAARPLVIPWGIAPFAGPCPSWEARKIDLLGVGSLLPLKDFRAFIRIVAELSREGRVGRAVLIGDGPEYPRLQKEIEERGLSAVIELRGAVPRHAVLETMAQARVLLHPSRYEGFGMVFTEARSRGMTIVSRAVGSAVAGPGWSLCESEVDFTAACRRQLLCAPGPAAPAADLSIRRTVDSYVALYRRMVDGGGPGNHA